MLAHYDEYLKTDAPDVKLRCRKGIPPSRRAAAWFAISGGKALARAHAPGTYEKLLERSAGIDPAVSQLIGLDVPRSFPDHRLLEAGGSSLGALSNVLHAYAAMNPEVGYCQVRTFNNILPYLCARVGCDVVHYFV